MERGIKQPEFKLRPRLGSTRRRCMRPASCDLRQAGAKMQQLSLLGKTPALLCKWAELQNSQYPRGLLVHFYLNSAGAQQLVQRRAGDWIENVNLTRGSIAAATTFSLPRWVWENEAVLFPENLYDCSQ